MFAASAPRLRAGSLLHHHHDQKYSPTHIDYAPYLPPPSPTYRSRGLSRSWRSSCCPSFTSFFRRRRVRTFFKLLLLAALSLLALFLLSYEPHIDLAFYSRAWIKQEIRPVAPLSGCFAPLRVSPKYNLSDAVYGPRRTDVQAGLPMRMGLDCYNFAGTIQMHRDDIVARVSRPWVPPDARTQFHTYWRTDLVAFGERQEWMIKSFFATQDVAASRLIIWSNGDLGENEILRRYANRYPDSFALRVVDIPTLARGTELHGSELLKLKDQKAWLDGDLLRLLLLWNFGGVWIDMDSLLTRDLTPLLEHEFVTQWDCYGTFLSSLHHHSKSHIYKDKPYLPLNGALMRFRQHSPYLCEAFHIMASSPPPRKDSTDWGSVLYLKLFRRLLAASIPPFKILPFCFSDARSCRLDNRLPDPFTPDPRGGTWTMGMGVEEGGGLDAVLAKVFGVHLHNQWEKSFPAGGWVDRLLLRRYEEKLKVGGMELESRSLSERAVDEDDRPEGDWDSRG